MFSTPELTKFTQEYCTNQAHAIDVLQSIRDERPNVADRLQVIVYFITGWF